MKTLRPLFRPLATALVAVSMAAPAHSYAVAGFGDSLAAPSADAEEARPATRETDDLLAQGGGCYAIAQGVAAQHGGTVARADSATRGGQQVCVIVVVVPARDGQRGRRLEFTVPQN